MLSCLQRGTVAEHSSAYRIECSLHSAFSTLHRAVHVESEPEICGVLPLPSSWCRAPAPTIASADGGYVEVKMPGQRLDYSRYCARGQSQRAVEGPRHRWCGLRRDTWACGRVWLLAGTRVVELVGTCSTPLWWVWTWNSEVLAWVGC